MTIVACESTKRTHGSRASTARHAEQAPSSQAGLPKIRRRLFCIAFAMQNRRLRILGRPACEDGACSACRAVLAREPCVRLVLSQATIVIFHTPPFIT